MQRRHGTLMGYLHQEMDLQSEERYQMAIDEDYNDHLQWTPEEAQILIERGQSPNVYNEGRTSIDWITGMEKRNRIDYRILPRRPEGEQVADVKTKVVKFTDDVNLARFHRSFAFKQAVVSGLGWLEEGLNLEPDKELIFSGSVDWKMVIRDSRSRDLDYNRDGRYLFRRRRLDLDYACALMPQCKEIFTGEATNSTTFDDIEHKWYLGERLTAGHDLGYRQNLMSMFGGRGAYIGTGFADEGRRSSIEFIEAFYKVPETVRMFARGPFTSKAVDEANPDHMRELQAGAPTFASVRWKMRVMICTEGSPCWDGDSPFNHQQFPLIPVFGFRRSRDGMCYGVWRGMRDPQDDLNKRMSKALWAANSNRVIADSGAVEDVDEARSEFSRPDGWIEVKANKTIKPVENNSDVQTSLMLVDRNRMTLRGVSGVTDENLGKDTNAQSGKAILAKQNQGSMTTMDLFENQRLAVQQAGQQRVANIEQFMTEERVIRLAGENSPTDWLRINRWNPETGTYDNDITAEQCDYIVDQQDWNASLREAALGQFQELIKIIAPTAPQLVTNLLDLVVDEFDISNREEIVNRIRAFNGQKDPSRKPTPEEQAAMAKQQAINDQKQQIQLGTMQATLDKLQAEVKAMDSQRLLRTVEALYSALQAGQIVAQVPGVAPVADTIAKGAGFQDQAGDNPQIPGPPAGAVPAAGPAQTAPNLAMPSAGAGELQGIETPAADGVQQFT
ncbi:MAG: hypothetical protein QM762_08820 [Chryseolinea sp.]